MYLQIRVFELNSKRGKAMFLWEEALECKFVSRTLHKAPEQKKQGTAAIAVVGAKGYFRA